MILFLLLVLILLPCVYWCYILYKNRSLHKIPGPTPIPFVGNVFSTDAYEMYADFKRLIREYGPLFRVYTGSKINVFFAKPENMEFIMTSNTHIAKSSGYDLLRSWLGDGLLTSSGKKWKQRRKLLTPAFHFKILEEFMDTFNSSGQTLIQQLSKQVGEESVDIYEFISLYSLDIICETAMGVKINAQENKNHTYVQAVKGFLEIALARFFSPWMVHDLLFRLFSSKYNDHKKYLKIVKGFTEEVIQKKRQEYSVRRKHPARDSDTGLKKKMALLDLLLTNEESLHLTNEDLREEIDTFMFEGHDTVTSGICFTLLEIARNPEIQEKLYEEIISVIGNEKLFSASQLNDLKYLDMVVKEGQRKIPSVSVIQRLIESDCLVEGIKYPKGTTITMFIAELHHNPDIYPDPDTFDPERFTLENQTKRNNFAYVPFSAGPRNCIGQRFAIYELKFTIAKVIQNFQLLPVPNFQEQLGFTGVIKSKNGVQIRLKARH